MASKYFLLAAGMVGLMCSSLQAAAWVFDGHATGATSFTGTLDGQAFTVTALGNTTFNARAAGTNGSLLYTNSGGAGDGFVVTFDGGVYCGTIDQFTTGAHQASSNWDMQMTNFQGWPLDLSTASVAADGNWTSPPTGGATGDGFTYDSGSNFWNFNGAGAMTDPGTGGGTVNAFAPALTDALVAELRFTNVSEPGIGLFRLFGTQTNTPKIVPEPSALGLVFLGLAAFLRRRR